MSGFSLDPVRTPMAPTAPYFGGEPSFSTGQAMNRLGDPLSALQANAGLMGLEQQWMSQTLLYILGMLAGLMASQQQTQSLNQSSGGGGGGQATDSSAGGGGQAAGGVGPNVPLGEATGNVAKFIDIAKAQQGDPYVFGATGPDKFDCSGLVYYSLRQAGVNVPRLTAAGYQDRFKDSRVDRANLKPGDLIFFHSANTRGIPEGKASHIEIYLGNGMSMGTDNPGEGARIEPVNWSSFIGGARVPELYR